MSVQTEKKEIEDPFEIQDELDDGPWMRCCPKFCGLGVMTFVMALLGIGFGAMLNGVGVQDEWQGCYVSDTSATKFSCWLELVYWPGHMWTRVLKCMVLPLMASLVLILPDKVSKIAPVGGRLIMLLTFTSFVAAMEGLFWGNVLSPGSSDAIEVADDNPRSYRYISEFESFLNVFTLFFPKNIFYELWDDSVIGTIAFFLVLGMQLTKQPAKWKDPILNSGRGFVRAILMILIYVMWFTPVAMFSLISYYIAKEENISNKLGSVGKYVGVQILGQLVHLFVFYFGFYFFATGNNPLKYFLKIVDAPVTALITSSSAATMPVTLRTNLEAGNVKDIVQFTIPLGAGMNMDGTSLGFPIMVLFAAQSAEPEFSIPAGTQFTMALLAMICSLGTAPLPNAGLVFLQMLFLAVDLPEDAQQFGFALILIFDWLVDRVETAQNVTSDSFICGILSHYFRGGNGPLKCCMSGMVDQAMIDSSKTGDEAMESAVAAAAEEGESGKTADSL